MTDWAKSFLFEIETVEDRISAFSDAVGVNGSPSIFVGGVPHRITGGELLANSHELLPIIGHEMGVRVIDGALNHALDLVR